MKHANSPSQRPPPQPADRKQLPEPLCVRCARERDLLLLKLAVCVVLWHSGYFPYSSSVERLATHQIARSLQLRVTKTAEGAEGGLHAAFLQEPARGFWAKPDEDDDGNGGREGGGEHEAPGCEAV